MPASYSQTDACRLIQVKQLVDVDSFKAFSVPFALARYLHWSKLRFAWALLRSRAVRELVFAGFNDIRFRKSLRPGL